MKSNEAQEDDLALIAAKCAKDPLAFVRVAFLWGEGELSEHDGPDEWAVDVLSHIRD